MRRSPLGSVESEATTYSDGTFNCESVAAAQAGKTTGLVGADVIFSPPPNPLAATASPEGDGFKVAVMEFDATRYCLATRLTSARVTALIACRSSSGELRPSAAS